MNSPHQREQLPDLLSDALGPAERARVESHLAQCEQCARELRALEQMQQTLAALPAATPPDSIRANVRAALQADQKQRWTLASLWANGARSTTNGATGARPLKNSERIGARKALPFALPARSLAWGGAVAVGAVGLMLLARPSLQTSAPGQLAPASETELAARADSADSGVAPANSVGKNPAKSGVAKSGVAKTPAAKTKTPKANGTAKPNQTASAPAPASSGAASAPDSVVSLPPLAPPPPLPPIPGLAQPESLAPFPGTKTPSFDASPNIAPDLTRKPGANKPGAGKPQKNSDASAPLTKPAAPPSSAPTERAAMRKQATSTPRPGAQSAATDAQSSALSATESTNSIASYGVNQSGDAPAVASARARTRSSNAEAFAPPMVSRVAPALKAPAPAAPQKTASSGDWPGGNVEATLAAPQISAGQSKLAAKNQTPVLTVSVDIAIGYARLFLLLPHGGRQVWRGSMNAAPIEIKLPGLAGQVRSGQKIRARLEQIDGEGNPKASTTFTVVWP